MASALPAAPPEIDRLREIAARMRVDIIEMLAQAGSGHPGGSLSVVEVLTCLFFSRMRHDPRRPDWPERDRLVLSKGHAVPALYAVLAEAGYFPRDELSTLRRLGSRLQGHPVSTALPGIEACTGSLGQGLSIAQGMALASRLDGGRFHVYCILGDGESQEGQVWEAAMSAAHFKVDALTVVLDYNRGQIDGPVAQVMDLEPVADKWRAFGWNVLEVDGHDIPQLLGALDQARATRGQPSFIVAHTVKGKGVSFMEHHIGWHGMAPNREQAEKALAELRAAQQALKGEC